MRKLAKLAKPVVLNNNDVAWTDELLAAAPGSAHFKLIEGRYGHQEIRENLSAETSRKCAYCESYIDPVSFPQIEHIRPKSLHPNLTFVWENLTLACEVCNVRKAAIDPDGTNFVHPYDEEPEDHFIFLGPVVAPKTNALAARNMINWIDLNRAGLIVSRAEIVSRVIAIYLEAMALAREARRQFIDLSLQPLVSRGARYSLAAKHIADICEREYGPQLEAV
jgi:uncharacterized protein (TIGR02646 family)